MKTSFSLLIFIFFSNILLAQFYTPNTGVNWNLDSLVNNSNTVITQENGAFYLYGNLYISQNDTLSIQTDDTLKVIFNVSINVNGAIHINPENEFIITAVDTLQSFVGLTFNNSQNSRLKRMTLEFSEGINITNSFVEIDSCIIRKNNDAITITNSSNNEITYLLNGNDIYKNGAGIKITGDNITGIISNNNIDENDLGQGYGIHINGDNTCQSVIFKNQITNNINGIYTDGSCKVLMGGYEYNTGISIGQNTFFENQEYDINNHSTSSQYANYNDWGTFDYDEIEGRIYDKEDNNSLGRIYYYNLYYTSPDIDYYPFPTNYTVWSVNMEKFIQDGDTSINSTSYKKIYFNDGCTISPENTSYKAAIREDIENKKLFIIPQDSTIEFLLYDFNLNIGDTAQILTIGSYWNSNFYPLINTIQVNNIDSILLEDGNYHKRFRLESLTSYNWEEYWIEGVGSSLGPIYPGDYFMVICKETEGYPTLLCVEQDGFMYYDNPWYTCCENVGGNMDEIDNKFFKVYPTITQSEITVEILNNDFNKNKIEIFDIYGKILKSILSSKSKTTVDVNSFCNGLYFIRIINSNMYQTGKFIVKR